MSFSSTIKVGPKLEHRYPYLTRVLGAREGPCKYLQESLVEKGQVLEGEKEEPTTGTCYPFFPGAYLAMVARYSKVTQPTSTISRRLIRRKGSSPSVTVHLIRNSPLCGGSSGGAGGRGTENELKILHHYSALKGHWWCLCRPQQRSYRGQILRNTPREGIGSIASTRRGFNINITGGY